MNRLIFHPDAVAEAEAQRLWYAQRSPAAAEGFADELEKGFAAIVEAPERCPTYLHGTRRFLLHRYPFIIVYRRLDGVIQIVAVAHGRRRPGYWTSR